MRKWYKPRLTKKQYKRSLAVLGVAALWLTAVWAMTLPSSQASAGRGFTSHAWGYSDATASKGAGGASPNTKGEELLQAAALAATKKFHDLCVGLLPGCDGHPAEAENADFHGSGISFSTGGFHADGGGGDRQTTGNDFSAGYGYGYGGGAFGGAFGGGLAPGGMGYGGFRAAVTADSVPDGIVTLESVENPDANNPLRFIKEDLKGPTEGPTDEPPPNFITDFPPDGPGSPKDTPTTDGPITTLAVPEPFTLSLFAMGLVGAAGARARKSRKARAAA